MLQHNLEAWVITEKVKDIWEGGGKGGEGWLDVYIIGRQKFQSNRRKCYSQNIIAAYILSISRM